MSSSPSGDLRVPRAFGNSSWAWVRTPDAAGLPCLEQRCFAPSDGVEPLRPAAGAAPGQSAPGGQGERHRLVPLVFYRSTRPRERPPAWCPVCLEPVRMKLGRVMRPHFAHLPEQTSCVAGTPEGQAHLQAKYSLASALSRLADPGPGGATDGDTEGPSLQVLVRCAGGAAGSRTPCYAVDRRSWVAGWDEVRVEESMPSVRSDLLLLRHGQPVGAIEIRATHALDDHRAEKYASLGVSWIEVHAEDVLGTRRPEWRPGEPLRAIWTSNDAPGRWRCPPHREEHERALEWLRNGVHVVAERVVHVYRCDTGRTGGQLRCTHHVARIKEERREGYAVSAWLEVGKTQASPMVAVESTETARVAGHRHFVEWARRQEERRGAVVDSPMRWAPSVPKGRADLEERHPERYRLLGAAFVAPPGLPRLAWPVGELAKAEDFEALVGPARAWTTEEGARPVSFHAVSGRSWVTVVRHHWKEDGTPYDRLDVEAHRHTGVRWHVDAPRRCTVVFRGVDLDRVEVMHRISEELAAAVPAELGAGDLETLVREVVGRAGPPRRSRSAGSEPHGEPAPS